MKKWIISFTFIVFMLLIAGSIYFFTIIREPLVEQFDQVERYVLNQDLLDSIDEISYYHGQEVVYVARGELDSIERYVWVTDDLTTAYEANVDEGITEEEAISLVHQHEPIVELQAIRIGLERNRPLYEITFINENERKSYYYLHFKDGTLIKRYSLRIE
ncbi:PepSY domain-containing protein [Bacillus sp. JCM 19034]|uniref:PepSY domain-containing protein n=1 Tax=Bacillus sp. JCM 19034 TaxID=1481928 RepID=UPI000B2569DF|nr:PepSY domain-containing protein [Bacillus sp. JCM 19034]